MKNTLILDNRFIKIPNEIISNISINPKRILIFSLLARNRYDYKAAISIQYLVNKCGYKIVKSNRKDHPFIHTLWQLSDTGLIYDCPDFNMIALNDFMEISLDQELIDPENNFGMVYYHEIDTILDNCKQYNIKAEYLLLTLAYLRLHQQRATKTHPYPAKVCFRRLKTISKDLDIHSNTLSKIITILADLKLIVSKTRPAYKNKQGQWCNGVTLFTDFSEDAEAELLKAENQLLSYKNKNNYDNKQ
jgi:hypothetical protein